MIRAGQPDDAEWIADIWNQIIRDTLITFTTQEKSVSDLQRVIAAAPVFLVDPPFGFATFGPFRAGPGYADAVEHTLHLAESARGQGRGRVLLSALEDQAKTHGIRHLVAGVSSANETGLRFHRAAGFQDVGRMPRIAQKNGCRLDLVLMQKNLQD